MQYRQRVAGITCCSVISFSDVVNTKKPVNRGNVWQARFQRLASGSGNGHRYGKSRDANDANEWAFERSGVVD